MTLPALADASTANSTHWAGYALGWLQRADITYWGDLDAAGFAILNAVRAHFPHTTSLLMDPATVTAFQHLAVPDPGDGSATLTHLTTEEQRAYRQLFIKGRLRIEQERFPFTHANTAIREAFHWSSDTQNHFD
nr:Wadjet anti-phage system protein JetD domain-containing protein [Corynebacterium sp. HMSC056E09]